MSRGRSCLLGSILAGLLFLGGACDGDSANSLTGSSSLDKAFDLVEIYWQESKGVFEAMKVNYKNTKTGEIPAIVIATKPVVQGVEKNLLTEGSLNRQMHNLSQFPTMKSGIITFDTLSGPDAPASGKFYVTFAKDGATLNGEFSGTAQKLTAD